MTDLFTACFPNDQWLLESGRLPSGCCVYRFINSDLRIALLPGLTPGTSTVCGVYILFRSSDDSMNMECAVPLELTMINAIIKTAVEMCGTKKLSNDKFLANLQMWCDSKNKRPIDVDQIRAVLAPTSSTTSSASTSDCKKRERVVISDDESDKNSAKSPRQSPPTRVVEEEKCCICLENEPDTVAIPCGCRVVCSPCSLKLNKDRQHAGLCAVCRQQMTHVNYPDNSMKSSLSKH